MTDTNRGGGHIEPSPYPSRVVIPEELAEEIRRDLAVGGPTAGRWTLGPKWPGENPEYVTADVDGSVVKLLVGSVDGGPRPEVGQRVLVLETRGIPEDEPYVATVVPGGDGGTFQVDTGGEWFSGVSGWALLPPVAAESGSPVVPGGSGESEPAETVSPNPPRKSLVEALMGDREVPPYVPTVGVSFVPLEQETAEDGTRVIRKVRVVDVGPHPHGMGSIEEVTPARDQAQAIAGGYIPPGPWRTGSRCPRNLYIGPEYPEGVDIGRMDSPELAALVVDAVNAMSAYDAPYRALAKSRAETQHLLGILADLRAWLTAERDELHETKPDDDTFPADMWRARTLRGVLGWLDERGAP